MYLYQVLTVQSHTRHKNNPNQTAERCGDAVMMVVVVVCLCCCNGRLRLANDSLLSSILFIVLWSKQKYMYWLSITLSFLPSLS